MDTSNQLINQVTGDYTNTDYQNMPLGMTDLEARSMPMPQAGHVIDYSQYQLDAHQAANYTTSQNLNMVMMPFANTTQVMPQFFTRIPIQSEEEQPMYVNAKQYHRIMKRRIAREKLNSLNPNHRKRSGYLHQSRHNHACKRPRGEGGRFLSKNSIKQQQQQQQQVQQSPQQSQQQVQNVNPNNPVLAVVLSALPPIQPQPTQMQIQQQQQQQQQLQQLSSQQTQTQTQQTQPQPHKLRSSKHSQSSSLSSSSSIPSPSREISPQIAIISPTQNSTDQHSIGGINSTDDISSSQSVQGFQQFQCSLQQLQQQIQIQTSSADSDSKTEPSVSAASMADNTLPPLDKDMLDNWTY